MSDDRKPSEADDLSIGMGIGMMGLSDLELEELPPPETTEEENKRLKSEMQELLKAYADSVYAVKFLVAHCQKNNIDPFPEGPLSLQESLKIIRELKPEELRKRNEEVTKRIVPRAKNPDSLKMKDAMEAQTKMVEEFKENPLIALLSEKSENGKRIVTFQEFSDAMKGRSQEAT